MLNYETILSSYDDKMTLMQWLKKVEEALNHASATAFRVNKKGNATISFILDFEDGTTLESGDIVLQQGESVNGAYIENNHLFITLTNGETIDAGLLFNGNLTINGIISANVVDGIKVTGNEIVEKMSGYSFEKGPNTHLNYSYAGVVKNGNKLTFAIAGTYTRTTGDDSNVIIGRFTIPLAIANKLYDNNLGALANANISLYKGTTEFVNLSTRTIKSSNIITTTIYEMWQLTDDSTYEFRFECTFLLSENLVGD